MKKYFYHNGTEQKGPFTIEELKTQQIKPEAPVWFEGLPEWTIASKVAELEELFKTILPPPFNSAKEIPELQTPPPFINEKQIETTNEPLAESTTSIANTPLPPKPKNNSILIGVLSLVVVIIIAVAVGVSVKKSSHSGSTINTESYQEKVMTIEEMERANPSQFLDASGTYNETFFGDKVKVHGTITNRATVAGYKDVVVEIIFYSATETELDRKQYVIYEFFPAHQTKNFELKIAKPQACKKLGWNAVSATPN